MQLIIQLSFALKQCNFCKMIICASIDISSCVDAMDIPFILFVCQQIHTQWRLMVSINYLILTHNTVVIEWKTKRERERKREKVRNCQEFMNGLPEIALRQLHSCTTSESLARADKIPTSTWIIVNKLPSLNEYSFVVVVKMIWIRWSMRFRRENCVCFDKYRIQRTM